MDEQLPPPDFGDRRAEDSDHRSVLEAIQSAVVVVGVDGVVRYANPAADRMFAIDHEQLDGAAFGLPLVDAGHVAEIELRTPVGIVSVEMHVEACRWRGRCASVVVLTDVTHRVRSEERLRALQERFELGDVGGRRPALRLGPATGHFHLTDVGLVDGTTTGRGLREPTHPCGSTGSTRRTAPVSTMPSPITCTDPSTNSTTIIGCMMADDRYHWTKVRARAVFDSSGAAVRLSGVLTDIDEQRAREDRLLHDSLHDSLTGLANRVLLRRSPEPRDPAGRSGSPAADTACCSSTSTASRRSTTTTASGGRLAAVDLADRMVAAVRPGDTVARLGGDEFGVLVDSFVDTHAVIVLARRLRTALARLWSWAIGERRRQRQHRRCGQHAASPRLRLGTARTGRRGHVPGQGRGREPDRDQHALTHRTRQLRRTCVSMRVTSLVEWCVGLPCRMPVTLLNGRPMCMPRLSMVYSRIALSWSEPRIFSRVMPAAHLAEHLDVAEQDDAVGQRRDVRLGDRLATEQAPRRRRSGARRCSGA